MRRAMEYLRWQLDHWQAQYHEREWPIFKGTKKIAHLVWQSWRYSALLVLILAFMPILFLLILFLSFVGFVFAVPLLCAAITYYLFFRGFSLPTQFTSLNKGLLAEPQPESRRELSTDVGNVRRGESDAKTILLLKNEPLRSGEGVEGNRDYQLDVPFEGSRGSSSSEACHSDAVLRGPLLHVPLVTLKRQHEETWPVPETGDKFSAEVSDELCKSSERETASGNLEEGDSNQIHAHSSPDLSSADMNHRGCRRESSHMVGTVSHGDLKLGVHEEPISAGPVQSEWTASVRESSGTPRRSRVGKGKRDLVAVSRIGDSEVKAGGPRMCTSGEEVKNWDLRTDFNTPAPTLNVSTMPLLPFENRGTSVVQESPGSTLQASVRSNFTPFSDSTFTFSGGIAHADADMIRPKHWRDEVEDTVLSSAVTESARDEEVFLASQISNASKKNVVEDDSRFTSLLTHQRRLSFSNVHADDKLANPGCYLLNDFMSYDYKQQSVCTSFSSDYPWSSECSEQGFEFRGAAYEEDTASSSAPTLEHAGVVLFFPTPDQLTEDWETRRRRWEEESTLGRLVPLSPHMEAHSARSICNPLFEFSTPSPPLKKLKVTQDRRTQDITQKLTPSLPETRFSKRHAAHLPESPAAGLLSYWRSRDRTASSTSPAEIALKVREEIDAVQATIGQEIPPQYSLWKEVEVLSQIAGLNLPYMGDMSDITKAKHGLDLLKLAVDTHNCDVD